MRTHKNFKKMLSMLLTMAMVWGILTVTAVASCPIVSGLNHNNLGMETVPLSGTTNFGSSTWEKRLKVITIPGSMLIGELHGRYGKNILLGQRVSAESAFWVGTHGEAFISSGSRTAGSGHKMLNGGIGSAWSGAINLVNNSATFRGVIFVNSY